MKFITALINRYRWRWIGTVEGVTRMVDDQGAELKGGSYKNSYWNLYERGDGKRRYAEIGEIFRYYASQGCRETKAKIDAWAHGGTLPPLHDSPEPEKPKPEGKLIVFRGGKDSA